MKPIIKTVAVSALLCAGVSASISASLSYAAAATSPDMADSPTPPTQYKSPFKDYRPLGDDKRTPWRDANDEVGKIGGWREYLRESQEANKAAPETAPAVKEMKELKAAPSARSAPSATPAPAPAKSPVSDNSKTNPKTKPSEHAGHGQHK